MTNSPLIRLALRAIHLLPQGAKGDTELDRALPPLLPSWEKVPEGRMRGALFTGAEA